MCHLLAHNDGVVDGQYVIKVPTSGVKIGQRLIVGDQECRQAIEDARDLCSAIVALLTP